jgi:hypothetical protein
MQRHKLYVAVSVAVAVVALAISATALGGSAEKGSAKSARGGGGHGQLISESSLLAGLASSSLFPFLDATHPQDPHRDHRLDVYLFGRRRAAGEYPGAGR